MGNDHHRPYRSRLTGCQVAIAAEGKHVYVMLRRFPSENLDQTPIRLDQALGSVFTELVYIDEVNPISESTVTY